MRTPINNTKPKGRQNDDALTLTEAQKKSLERRGSVPARNRTGKIYRK